MDRLELASSDVSIQRAVRGVIAAIGAADFERRALDAVNECVLAASWSVYRTGREFRPVLHLSCSRGVPDQTRLCFREYLDGLYRHDGSFDAVPALPPPGGATVLLMRAEEAPTRAHRERIYRRHGLRERLSVAVRGSDRSVLAVNLYHHRHQGAFSAVERDRFSVVAPVLLAAVQRHLELCAPVTDVRRALRDSCPRLTERELDVCERLLRGWTYDGIAADLGVTVATVKTLRARAFARLGLHFRSELFARFVGASASPSRMTACGADGGQTFSPSSSD